MTAVQTRSTRRKRSDGLSVTVPVALRASTPAALVVLPLKYGLGIDAHPRVPPRTILTRECVMLARGG
jgi:hypothetical protein